MNKSVAILLALALAGCAQEAVQMAGAGDSLQRAWKDQPTGYLVGSIGRIKVDFHSAQEMAICQRDFGRIATLKYRVLFDGVETRQIDEADYVGESFSLALPAGDYTICGSGWGPGGSLAISLKVEAGKLNYIGRYVRVMGSRPGYLGLLEETGGYWRVKDQPAADLPYIVQRDPKLAGLPVVSALPRKEDLPSPQFTR